MVNIEPNSQSVDRPTSLSIHHLLEIQKDRRPDAVAIAGLASPPFSFRRLLLQVEQAAKTLNALGIGRNDRVAMVTPNGPEMALAFLAVSSAATFAPLNPACRTNEFEFYLSDLNAKALIVQSSSHSPAIAVARKHSIAVIELSPAAAESDTGIFSIGNEKRLSLSQGGFAQAEDVALILHTSGTTARPKMVPLTHANLLASASHIAATLQLTENDRCLNVMPLFHIHGLVGAVLAAIVAGSEVVCTPGIDLEQFFSWLEEFRPTWYTAVPTMHQAILKQTEANRSLISGCSLRLIRSSSAPLPPTVTAQLEDVFKVPVIEAYGMTEASHQIASNPLPPRRRKTGSVGVATGSDVAIVDEQGQFLPAGRHGEIVIRGVNITRGYANNPEANKEAFTDGWFRTGDQGYLDEDGYLFITGRLKEIINRGGEKIAPREVDDVLLDHPAVAQAVTFAVPHATLGEDVAAAVVLEKNASVTEIELQRLVGARLAEFKIPQRVLFVDEIPKSATGKIRRFDLAEKLGLGALHSLGRDFMAPRSEVEKILAKIWSQVLGGEHVSIQDNFFQLGGDSIRAGQIIARVRQALQVDLSVSSFFETPTIAGLAKGIERVPLAAKELEAQPLLPIARNKTLPLSFAQQRLWFFDQFEPGNPIYNRPVVLRLTGRLHADMLERCLNEIVARHEILRTNFSAAGGEPVQVINPSLPLKLRVTDLSDLTSSQREGEALRQAVEESRKPFDLVQEALVRANLFRLSEQEHLLLWLTHHIVFDGWSDNILLDEFTTLYTDLMAGRSSSLPQLTVQYSDHTLWQRSQFEDQSCAQDLSYWKRQLDNAPQALNLATDRPRPPRQTYRGARHTFSLPVFLSDQLKDLSRRAKVTCFMTLFAAFNTLLYRYTGQDDLLVGVPVAGRSRVETERLMGVFINTLALRTELGGKLTFLELLQRIRDVALQAYQHQELPFERLVETLRPDRDLSRAPLFQVMFQLRNLPQWNGKIPGLRVDRIQLDIGVARFDLTLEVGEMQGGLECTFEYSTDLFDPATIERMQGHFQTLLEGITANPDQRLSDLPLMTRSERDRLLVEWNDTHKDYPSDKRIHELFEEQVERTPDSVAVVFEGEAVTYRELNRRANQLAHYLIGLGVGPEVLVGVCLERSMKMVVAVLGVLKSGAAYIPLDPSYPRERLRFMLEDAQATLVLTQDRLAESFSRLSARVICPDRYREEIALQGEENPETEAQADNLAYVIFTSGSTGKPKGVQVQHRTAMNLLSDVRERLRLNGQDTSLFVASLSFDISVMELFLPLSLGARVVVVSSEVAADGPRLMDQLSTFRATVMHATPATWRLLIQAGWQGRLAMILCGGEALQPDLAAQLITRGTSVWNLYGPTETTIYSSAALYQSQLCGGKVSIGRPIANTQIYLLDDDLRSVPIGVAGELYIGGAGVTRGYLNRSEMTAEKFIPDPYSVEPGARLYRTGDLACYLPDGNIEYLGRIDHQVKIRGFRIELGEIESVLSQHPTVLENVVMAREDTSRNNRLVAYVITRNKASVTISALRDFLKGKLPDYMMPSQFVFLDSLPLTPNGKLDRTALPQPDQTRPELIGTFVAPRTPVEELLAELWAEVLNLERVGIHDNFFELGGHSLLATQVVSRVRQAFQMELPLRSLFENPTIEGFANIIQSATTVSSNSPMPAIKPLPRQLYSVKQSG